MADTGAAKLPGLPVLQTPDTALARWAQAVAEHLEVRAGSRGNPLERAVTLRELASATTGLSYLQESKTRQVQAGDVVVDLGGGLSASVSISKFIESIRNTKLYKDLMKSLDDPTRFDHVPEKVRQIVLASIAEEAANRGADVRRLEYKLDSKMESMAYTLEQVTASVAGAAAGVRETTYAYANLTHAQAGKITQLQARLDGAIIPAVDILGPVYATYAAMVAAVPSPVEWKYYQVLPTAPATMNELWAWNAHELWHKVGRMNVDGTGTMFGTAAMEQELLVEADRVTGLRSQYTIKLKAGGAIAGFGLAATETTDPVSGATVRSSACIIQADKFALVAPDYAGGLNVSPDAAMLPFGVDMGGYGAGTYPSIYMNANVYINGLVRVGSGGPTMDTIVSNASTALANAATAQAAADGKIDSFYQATAPAVASEGDIWFDTNDGNKIYTRRSGVWVATQDSAIAAAIASASTAQGTADGKATVYYQISNPGVKTAGDNGDIWIDTDDNNKMYVYSHGGANSGWILAQDWYTANAAAAAAQTTANTAVNGLTTKLNSDARNVLTGSGGLVAGTMTWNTSGVRTGGYGVAMTSNGIAAYNSSGNPTFTLNGSTGDATFYGALSAASGSFAGTMTVGTSPAVSGSSMTGTGGVINSGGTFALGNSTTNISFNGSTLTLNGSVVATGNITENAVTKMASNTGYAAGCSISFTAAATFNAVIIATANFVSATAAGIDRLSISVGPLSNQGDVSANVAAYTSISLTSVTQVASWGAGTYTASCVPTALNGLFATSITVFLSYK